jgi:hypothetical protein
MKHKYNNLIVIYLYNIITSVVFVVTTMIFFSTGHVVWVENERSFP